MRLKILFIEDDPKLGKNLRDLFQDKVIRECPIDASLVEKFEDGIEIIKQNDFDIVILDLFKDTETKDEKAGIKVLDQIRANAFVPVVFFSGHSYKVQELESEMVRIVNKGDGTEALESEISRIIDSKLALLKRHINAFVGEALRQYFWETVDTNKQIFSSDSSDFSLGYLLLRRLAQSLSKDNIKRLLKDDKISDGKAHPMEFYIYPSPNGEFSSGEILSKDGRFFSVLTPSCDFVGNNGRTRKVGAVLLAHAIPLIETEEYKQYKKDSNKYKQKLESIIESRKSDRYFFLPSTAFIDNHVIDFQRVSTVDYSELKGYQRVAILDDPFAQSMIASFIRHYNRIGFPDIDSEHIINNMR